MGWPLGCLVNLLVKPVHGVTISQMEQSENEKVDVRPARPINSPGAVDDKRQSDAEELELEILLEEFDEALISDGGILTP